MVILRTKRNQRWLWIALFGAPDTTLAATVAPTVVAICDNSSPKAIAPVAPAATSGKRINWPLMPQRTAPWARKQAKPPTSNVGTTPCANAWLDLCARLWLFPSPTTFTNWPCSCSSMTTTCSAYQSICNHYHFSEIGKSTVMALCALPLPSGLKHCTKRANAWRRSGSRRLSVLHHKECIEGS